MNKIVDIIIVGLLFLPVFIGIGYPFYYLFKEICFSKKTDKFWFYNLFLPSLFCTLFFLIAAITANLDSFKDFWPFFMAGGMIIGFCVLYPFYMLFYYVYARIFSCKYYGTKSSLLFFLISFVISVITHGLVFTRLW